MAHLIIPEPLASRLRQLAEQENSALDDLLTRMIDGYEVRQLLAPPPAPEIPEYPPRPTSSLTDADIEVPEDIKDRAAYRAAERALRPKLYEIARDYWRKIGDTERLKMTDEELDKAFWLIDHEGVPRFKSERESIVLPSDPLAALVGLFADSPVTNALITVRETMAKKYGRPD